MPNRSDTRASRAACLIRPLGWALLVSVILACPAYAQTSAIPLSTLAPGPTNGVLPNGVGFTVNVGSWHSAGPTNTQGYIIYPAQNPQIWTFDTPVSLRFGLRGLNGAECFVVPLDAVAETIHPGHSWDPATGRLCRVTSGPNDESTFTLAGPVTELRLSAVGANAFGRGVGFIEVTVNARIDIEKTATGPDPLVLGSVITYSFLVTNTGDVDLTNVVVTDVLSGMTTISCPSTTLAAGADMTCTATYEVTQDDVNTGFVTNTATVTGDPPGAVAQVSAQDSATIPPTQTRSIALVKTASAPDASGLVTYTFEVRNTGNVTLNSVTVSDPLQGLSPVSCQTTTLAPTQVTTCTATRTLTQADIDAGFVQNTATATGTPQAGAPVSAQDSATVSTTQAVGITLEKAGSGPDPLTLNATVAYSFTVTNIGQLELSGIAVVDPLPGLQPIVCPATTLAPGASTTCTANYTITQADVDAGFVQNTATVTGTPPNGLSPVSADASTTVPPSQTRGIVLEKSGTGPAPLTPGATVTYTFGVTNTGNVSLTNVVVTDPLPGLSAIACPATTLAAGASMTCTATYVVTDADATAGVLTNSASVSANPPSGPAVISADAATLAVMGVQPVPAIPRVVFVIAAAVLALAVAWRMRMSTSAS